MAQTRNSQIRRGSKTEPIVVELADIATRLDVILATLKDDVEAIKDRMHRARSRCHNYEPIFIKSEVPTPDDYDFLCKSDHIRSDLDLEVGRNCPTGDEVMGDDSNGEEADDDEKDMAAEDSTIAKMKPNQNSKPSKDQHETMNDVFGSSMVDDDVSVPSLNMVFLKKTIEHLVEFKPKRLEKIGGLGRDLNLFMEEQSARMMKSKFGIFSNRTSTIEADIGEEKFMLYSIHNERDAIRLQHKSQTGGSFKGSLS